jgi:glycosyltransferase involved in cell wall biosynthesis
MVSQANDLPICFDARMAQASGIGTYIRGLLGALSEQGQSLKIIVSTPDDAPHNWPKQVVPSRFYSLGEQLRVPIAFWNSRARLLHAPHYNLPIAIASRCIVTVHDLIHLKFPEFLPSKLAGLYAHSFLYRWVPKARAILTVSEHSRKDLIETLGIPAHKITVTYPGVSRSFRPQTSEEVAPILEKIGLQPGYFLYVGNLKPFKNVERVLDSYVHFRARHPNGPEMVFVGRNFIPGFDQRLKKSSGVRWLAELGHADLPAIYAAALALIFPSLYEGFGLPPLEAMACGTPVVCSRRASLPEVVGDAAILVDPLSTDEIRDAMIRIWSEPGLREKMGKIGADRAKSFTWERTAQQTLAAYERALS